MRLLFRFFGFLFALGTLVFVVGVGALSGLIYHYNKDLPDYSQLQDYEPPVMTRVHAADGALLAEYAKQRRLYLPIQAIPKLVLNAFISAEDKNFYEHPGLDMSGIFRAGMVYAQNVGKGRRPQGASTITQQVAKNFLLTNEVSFDRKIKEALLALRIERTYSKDKILELYLNEIYLGFSAYGVAAASLLYFDKSVNELTMAEAAYLAALPKAPSDLHPFRNRDRAVERRNYVIERMVENGYVTAEDGEKAKKEPLTIARAGPARTSSPPTISPRRCGARFSTSTARSGSTRAASRCARPSTRRSRGWPARRCSTASCAMTRGTAIAARSPRSTSAATGASSSPTCAPSPTSAWRLAVVLETGDQAARIGLQPAREPGGAVVRDRQIGIIPSTASNGRRPPSAKRAAQAVTQVLDPGDVDLCRAARRARTASTGCARFPRCPAPWW